MRRVIFCGLFSYPRGGAHSNYVQYLALALQAKGYRVEIVSYINEEYSRSRHFDYRGVSISEISCKNGPELLRRLMNGKLFSCTLRKRIKAMHLTKDDVVIPSDYYPLIKAFLHQKKRSGFKTAGTPLEWFADEDLPVRKARNEYKARFSLYHCHDLLFPISRLIAGQFPDVPSMILPIMTDTQEFPLADKKEGDYEFILSARGKMKDALPEMLRGMAMLSDEQLHKMKMHLTGIKEETIRRFLSDKEYDKINPSLIIHKWMRYDELIKLYQKVHYLFLSRRTCQMTLANFPSKVPEAMTHGIVPVVSRVGDYTEYYLQDNIDSLVFDGYDKNVCYKAYCRALEMPFSEYLQLSRSARKCAEQRFDFRNWSDKISEKIESLF